MPAKASKVTSLQLTKKATTPTPSVRGGPLTLGRGGKVVAGTSTAPRGMPGVGANPAPPKPLNLPSLRKENKGIDPYGESMLPPSVLNSGTWRAQDPSAAVYGAPQTQSQQSAAPGSPSITPFNAHFSHTTSGAADPSSHPATPASVSSGVTPKTKDNRAILESDQSHIKGAVWANMADSDEDMDYSAPVVFSDGTTTLSAAAKREDDRKKAEEERLARAKAASLQAAERERVRLEKAAAAELLSLLVG